MAIKVMSEFYTGIYLYKKNKLEPDFFYDLSLETRDERQKAFLKRVYDLCIFAEERRIQLLGIKWAQVKLARDTRQNIAHKKGLAIDFLVEKDNKPSTDLQDYKDLGAHWREIGGLWDAKHYHHFEG